jgi:hypothetical protein
MSGWIHRGTYLRRAFCLLPIRAEIAHDLAEPNGMDIKDASRDKIVEWILDMGLISSVVCRWYRKIWLR